MQTKSIQELGFARRLRREGGRERERGGMGRRERGEEGRKIVNFQYHFYKVPFPKKN